MFILGRTTMPFLEEDLSADILFDEPLLVVAGIESRWASRRKIELADLIGETWMLPPADTAAGALIRQTFLACGLESPRGAVVSASVQMQQHTAGERTISGYAAASMLRFGAKPSWVTVQPVKLPALPRPVGIITSKGRMTSPAAQLFIDCTREVGKLLARR
jgi:DNA-binding transcriptional LysR family regulator